MSAVAVVSLLKLAFLLPAPLGPAEKAALAHYQKTGDPAECEKRLVELERELERRAMNANSCRQIYRGTIRIVEQDFLFFWREPEDYRPRATEDSPRQDSMAHCLD
jgi:hypothetical protein